MATTTEAVFLGAVGGTNKGYYQGYSRGRSDGDSENWRKDKPGAWYRITGKETEETDVSKSWKRSGGSEHNQRSGKEKGSVAQGNNAKKQLVVEMPKSKGAEGSEQQQNEAVDESMAVDGEAGKADPTSQDMQIIGQFGGADKDKTSKGPGLSTGVAHAETNQGEEGSRVADTKSEAMQNSTSTPRQGSMSIIAPMVASEQLIQPCVKAISEGLIGNKNDGGGKSSVGTYKKLKGRIREGVRGENISGRKREKEAKNMDWELEAKKHRYEGQAEEAANHNMVAGLDEQPCINK